MQFKVLTAAALLGYAVAQEATPGDLVSTLANQTELSNLTSFLSLFPDFVGQLSQLQNITLLAPNNEAFTEFLNSSAGAALAQGDQQLIQGIFQYHVLNGTYADITNTSFVPTLLQPPTYTNVTGGQVVAAYPADGDDAVAFYSGLLANASVVGEALNFTGGVIHIINQVLTIPQNVSETAVQLNLSAIAGALTSAGLAETVDGVTDITVFVPDNEAFQAIGSALPNLTTEQVTAILQYHVVQGVVGYSTALENGTSLTTLQGNNVTITIQDDDDIFVNGARVIVADVLVANGVVHVIDNVLNPDNSTATPGDGDDGEPAFEGASSASDVAFTSGVPTPTATAVTSEAPGAGATTSSGGGAMPVKTGAVGAAALFGGAAILLNNM